MDKYSFLNAASTAFFGDLYDKYQQNPDAVEPSWRAFFQGFDFAQEQYGITDDDTTPIVVERVVNNDNPALLDKVKKEFAVLNLINGYRTYGHLFAQINPLRPREPHTPTLEIEKYGLSSADLNTVFDAAAEIGLNPSPLSKIIETLQATYCKSVGVQYQHIQSEEERTWITQRLQLNHNTTPFTKEQKLQILEKLNQATSFENFLHTKYVGQKRFSLEGNDSLIPGLDFMVEAATQYGVTHLVLGMAHRGRLNVLANIFHKNPQNIFSEFDGKDYEMDDWFDGDVKYHLGITTQRISRTGKTIDMNLVPNPSHLEAVNAVVAGITRAKQDRYCQDDARKALPIIIHGDAAASGQGIVYETVQMCGLKGFTNAGTVHIVINNQVGFTANFSDSRSSVYCTDIAKINDSPVLHVNADDAEAVVHTFLFALDYRQTFGKDVYINLFGYRKYGHNEGDEPRFTQPLLYKIIGNHDNPSHIYTQKLIGEGVIQQAYVTEIENAYKAKLDADLEASRREPLTILKPFMQTEWEGFEIASPEQMLQKVNTSVSKEKLIDLATALTEMPEGKSFINKVKKVVADRKEALANNHIDWGMAELLAYGSLLTEGFDVRITGEDVQRGTFSHRHAVLKTDDTEEEVCFLKELKAKQPSTGTFHIYNSLLSEYGVLGYEYGYAMASPRTLTIWEAQFGDFSNGAQIMLDQYVCCGEDKWKVQDGLVMLLPHGYEGQGAEHSSARVERYLQLCAENNMYVTNCTTPANFFHLLRRQMKTTFRKPLVVFTPKSLLRHPQVISKIEDLAEGHFQEVLDDPIIEAGKVKHVVFCSGRYYYDLYAQREKLGRDDVALVRIEQLFPLPVERLKEVIAKYTNATDFIWAQEEPKNMGAYGYMLMNFNLVPWRYVGTPAYAAPASGSHTRDRKRHNEAIARVFEE